MWRGIWREARLTCIAGLVDGRDVWIGGDSAGVAGGELTVRRDAKVFRRGEFLFGATSSFRMMQLIQYSLEVPSQSGKQSVDAYLRTTFVDALRECLSKGGFARTKDGAELGGTFLMGYRGRLFKVGPDYQVGESRDPYDAAGCGSSCALGALFASKGKPRERILTSLRAAERMHANVRGPFVVRTLHQ